MHQDSMLWIQCSVVKWIPSERSGFNAVWPNGSRLNAVSSMQHGPMYPDWMQWIPCSMAQLVLIDALNYMRKDWMQWIPCIKIQCGGFNAALWNGSRVNAVDSMQCGPMDPEWMEWIPCSVIECSGFNAEWWNVSRLNEVDLMQLVVIDTDWMHGFNAVWFNELDSM